jgi:hypothetical protein
MSPFSKSIIIGLSLTSSLLIFSSGNTKADVVRGADPQQQRIVVKKPWLKEPVQIIAAKTKKKANIEIGKEFDAEDDWIEGFTVTVSNNYHKTVTSMTINMIFRRDAGDLRSPFSYPLHFGSSANTAEYLQRDPGKIIKVGKTANLELSAEDYKRLKGYLEQTGYIISIKRVELVVTEVGFEDGSMIYGGTFFLQDPASPRDPTKKIRVPEGPGAY